MAEKPLWELWGRGKASRSRAPAVVIRQQPDGTVTRLKGKQAKAATTQLARPQPGTVPPPVSAPWRFRHHLTPFWWLGAGLSGLVLHHLGVDWWPWPLLAYGGLAAATVAMTRHLPRFPRRRSQLFASWAAASGLQWCAFGNVHLVTFLMIVAWAADAGRWVHHYGWRPERPHTEVPQVDQVKAIWAAMAAKRRWSATLGPGKPIPSGMQWPVKCVGTETHIGEISSKPEWIAAAYDKPITQAYVEHHPSGVLSMGTFTMLERETLQAVRLWSGGTIDPRTGLAVVGRFPDGKNVHEKFYSLPKDGISHTLIAGDMGSGKSALIDLSMTLGVISGLIAPIILDPQMGQALPAWQEHTTYACGTDECMKWLRAVHAAMFDRSAYLASLTFKDPQTGKWRKGMGFFNPHVRIRDPETGLERELGLPIIEITIDESPILLAIKGALPLILDIAKLGRKVGFRLRLVAQVPSLAEMKAQELRSMLRGSNVFCLRSGDNVTGGYTGVTGDPNLLAKYWADGTKTYGLGYADTIDAQSATPMRTDLVPDPYEVAETTKIRRVDDRAAAKMAEILAQEDATIKQLHDAADAMAQLKLNMLSLLAHPRTQGELLAVLVPQGHPLSQVTEAISQLADDRKIRESGGRYVAV